MKVDLSTISCYIIVGKWGDILQKKSHVLIKQVNQLSRITQMVMDEELMDLNITSGTYSILLCLSNNEGISQNDISRNLHVDKAGAARSLDKLEGLGFIKREEDKNDHRIKKVFLTDKAKETVPLIRGSIEKWYEVITNDMNENEKQNLEIVMDKILCNAREYKDKIRR